MHMTSKTEHFLPIGRFFNFRPQIVTFSYIIFKTNHGSKLAMHVTGGNQEYPKG